MKRILCLILVLALVASLCVPVFAQSGAGPTSEGFGNDLLITALICFGVGALIGLIVVLVMKSRMKTVRFRSGADSYVDADRLELTKSADVFLYQTVTRHAKPQNNRK